MTITGGTGMNTFESTDLSVGKGLAITNTSGGSSTTIARDGAGFSSIGGNLKITNGAGDDETGIADTNIGGNVTVNDGAGDGGKKSWRD